MSEIYRKVALERLSSPEELDSLMRVTTPKGWLALFALGGLIFIAILWGFFGSIPTKVAGQGILIKPGGIHEIVSMTSGQVTAVSTNPGDMVQKGQVIARVAQPKLIEEISRANAQLKELKEEYEKISGFGTEDIKMRVEYLSKRRKDSEKAVQLGQERLKWLNEILASRRQLLEQGLITKQNLIKSQEDIQTTTQEVERARSELKEISIQEFQVKEQRERELLLLNQKISQQERQIAALEYDLEENSRVISPYSGRVLEIVALEGKLLDRGGRILILESTGDAQRDLEAVVYLSPSEGKRVRPGMKMLISPTSTRQEESGSMLATVARVSEFPATPQGMMRTLQNERLVQALCSGPPPIELYAELVTDPTTESKYKWSSGKGPLMKIQSGTMCIAAVIVEEQPPASLVIPLLKKVFLGVGEEKAKGIGQ